jgi:alkyl hydroperoxide reductase subunit F
MTVENSEFTFEFEGKKYYFCSEGCLNKFIESNNDQPEKRIYDLIIIGGGPAGLTAAVYASISRMNTFLIAGEIGGQAIDSSKIKNYMGFDFITGKELTKKFKDQFLNEHYLSHKIDEVIEIKHNHNKFEVITKGQDKLFSHSVIISTGMKKRKLGIPGEDRLQRKGISYSSVQDLGLFSGLDIVIIGGGNSGVQTANDLSAIGCKVNLITKGEMIADPKDIEKLKLKDNIQIIEEHNITEILGTESVEGVIIQSEKTLETKQINCKGVFIQVGFLPNTEFCKNMVDLNKKGEIIIDSDCSTNTEGLFACGDVTNAFGKRIVIASGEGAKAALSVKQYLSKQKLSSKNRTGTSK